LGRGVITITETRHGLHKETQFTEIECHNATHARTT
jgi:hypothetical protein